MVDLQVFQLLFHPGQYLDTGFVRSNKLEEETFAFNIESQSRSLKYVKVLSLQVDVDDFKKVNLADVFVKKAS